MPLSPEEVAKRKDTIRKAEIARAESLIYWLSFVDPHAPQGQRFLGVVVIEAYGPLTATEKAWELGINPGGEVQISVLETASDKYLARLTPLMNKLLSKKELEENNLI